MVSGKSAAFQEEAIVRIAGVLIRNAVQLQDIGHLRSGYGAKAQAVARDILINCYPDEDTFDPNTAQLLRQVKDRHNRIAELEAENAVLWAFVDAFKRWGREEGSEAAVYEALADLIPYEGGRG